MKFLQYLSWVDDKNLTNINKVTTGKFEVALSQYNIESMNKEKINIGFLIFKHVYYSNEIFKIPLEYNEELTFADYMNQITKEKIMQFLYQEEYIRRRNHVNFERLLHGANSQLNIKSSWMYTNKYNISYNNPFIVADDLLLPKENDPDFLEGYKNNDNNVMKEIIEFFQNLETKHTYEPPHVFENENSYFLHQPQDTYLHFTFNHSFNIKNLYSTDEKEFFLFKTFTNANLKIKNILLCLKILFDDALSYTLRYISLSQYNKEYENVLYISRNIKYIRNIKIIITDPTQQEISSVGSVVLHFQST